MTHLTLQLYNKIAVHCRMQLHYSDSAMIWAAGVHLCGVINLADCIKKQGKKPINCIASSCVCKRALPGTFEEEAVRILSSGNTLNDAVQQQTEK